MVKKLLLIIAVFASGIFFWQSTQIASAVRKEVVAVECSEENQCCAGIVQPTQPECASVPTGGYKLRDENLPSRALCRGACGRDCNQISCSNGGSFSRCYGNETSHRICDYFVTSCGSHPACRTHDACYDDCVEFRPPEEVSTCQWGCDLQCQEEWPVLDCLLWADGYGPQPDILKFVGRPLDSGLLPGPCPVQN